MKYAQYQLHDRGYYDLATGEDLDDITGLTGGFAHRGIAGYPVTHAWMTERDGRVLAAHEGDIDEGGVEVPAEDVPARLGSDYGWPAGAALGTDGLPVWPGEA